MQPALVVYGGLGRLRIVVVAEHVAVTARTDFSDGAERGDGVSQRIADRYFDLRERLADSFAQILNRICCASLCQNRRSLGLAIDRLKVASEYGPNAPHQFRRNHGAARYGHAN